MSSAVDYVQLTHAASEIDGTIDEVYAARGPYGNLSLKIASKQDVITSESKLSSDLIDDTGTENLFVSASDKSAWSGKQDPATTLSGYGITDAYTKSETDTALSGKQGELSQSQLAAANSGITAEKLAADEAALAEVVNNGAKNLLNCSLTEIKSDSFNSGGAYQFTWNGNVCTSTRGVTFTVNSDNSIDVVATSVTADVWLRLKESFQYGVGSYVISGCPSGGSTTTYYIESDNLNARDTGSSIVIERSSAYTDNIFLVVKAGTTFTGTFKPMICSKSQWAVSQKFEPYALSNPTLTPAAIKAVDEGAKNLSSVNSVTNQKNYIDIDVNLKAGKYIIFAGSISTTSSDTSIRVGVYKRPNNLLYTNIDVGSNKYSEFEISDAADIMRIFATSSTSISSGEFLTFSDLMICTAAEWAVSQKFVPYCPTMAEMYAMILALQNGTRSAPTLAKTEPEETAPETGEEEMR